MQWQEQLPGFISGVLASLVAMAIYPAIGRLLFCAYRALKQSLKQALNSCFLVASKICSFFKELSFQVAKRRVTRFVLEAGEVLGGILWFCAWAGILLYGAQRVFGGGSKPLTEQTPIELSTTHHCPTIHSTDASDPSWSRLVQSNCTRPCGVTTVYSTTPALYVSERIGAHDCSLGQKGRKARSLVQPCATRFPNSTSGYNIDDAPQ
jgi:hypothetical protein